MNLEQFLLICLAEEAGELVQACTKCLTFGFDGMWDEKKGTNREELIKEYLDVVGTMVLLVEKKEGWTS